MRQATPLSASSTNVSLEKHPRKSQRRPVISRAIQLEMTTAGLMTCSAHISLWQRHTDAHVMVMKMMIGSLLVVDELLWMMMPTMHISYVNELHS
jgi:hypothetical protein